jgi:transposase
MHTDTFLLLPSPHKNSNKHALVLPSYEAVSGMFGMKLEDVANHFGVRRSTMKRMCRKLGIERWPTWGTKRKLRKLDPNCCVQSAPQINSPPTCNDFEDVVTVRPRPMQNNERRGGDKLDFTVDTLSIMFGYRQDRAAQHFGVSLTTFKKICGRLGIRWPKTYTASKRVSCNSMSEKAFAKALQNVNDGWITDELNNEPPLDLDPSPDLSFDSMDGAGYDVISGV